MPAVAARLASASRGRRFAEATLDAPKATRAVRMVSWLGLHGEERFAPELGWLGGVDSLAGATCLSHRIYSNRMIARSLADIAKKKEVCPVLLLKQITCSPALAALEGAHGRLLAMLEAAGHA